MEEPLLPPSVFLMVSNPARQGLNTCERWLNGAIDMCACDKLGQCICLSVCSRAYYLAPFVGGTGPFERGVRPSMGATHATHMHEIMTRFDFMRVSRTMSQT